MENPHFSHNFKNTTTQQRQLHSSNHIKKNCANHADRTGDTKQSSISNAITVFITNKESVDIPLNGAIQIYLYKRKD